jgi:hypothetical protein
MSGKKTLFGGLKFYNPVAVILDESHYCINPDAVRTDAVFGSGGIVENAKYVWPMTGTPVKRYSDDLHPTLGALFPDILKEHRLLKSYQFRRKFCITKRISIGHGRVADKTVGSINNGILYNLLYTGDRPLAIRRTEIDLPPLTFRDIDVSYERDGDIDQLLKDASAVITETDEDGSEITVMNTAISKAWSALAMAKSEDVREYILELLMDQRQRGVVVFFYHIALGR